MKKFGLIGVGFVLAVVIFGVAGFAYAQTQNSPEPQTTDSPEFPFGRAGWSRGTNGNMMSGMMGFGLDDHQPGTLHDYLWPAVAESFSLTDAQIEAFEIVRESIQDIQKDLTQEEIRDTMKQAIATAIENAFADGGITEEQAEVWMERLEQMENVGPGKPFGPNSRFGIFRQGYSRGVKFGRQTTLNQEYLDTAIALELDISVDELHELRSQQGFSLPVYVIEVVGLNDDEFTIWQAEVYTNAVNAALEDGAITQEQADWALERLEKSAALGGWFAQP